MSEQRALLLTDVVDSTQLAERLGDAAAAELNAAHDRVARDLLRRWRGREIDKTDGMLMLFERADDALGFAIAYHQALLALPVPLRARAGLHYGEVILRGNTAEDVAHGAKPLEVEGIAKPIAARVMSLAMGGQTLLTAEARAALGEAAVRVQSHGHWRIKGIAEPVELFEAGDDGAPFTPPPDSSKLYRVVRDGDQWLPVRQLRHSLPAERDAFVGRQQALVDLARRFDGGARLVSVLGIGGTGKTRLALRFARCWLGDFPGGAWFCDLSQARNVDGLVHAVAQGLDVPLGKDDPVVQLGHAIAGRGRCLVILDNFEQIVRHAEATLGRWLDRAVDARFLVTTREVLGLPGEEAVALAPLPTPDAAALFVQRAASTKFDFRAGPDDQAAIQQLVKLLDGLPLAIELAAARVRVMSPATLLSRMDQRFKLLAAMGGRQDRQATLRATFDWSWDLLSDAEKSALAQLSVFEGGFTLAAAEAVIDLSACADAPWSVDVVHSLVDKSFVQQVSDGRFDLLVSVQEYAAEQMQASEAQSGTGRRDAQLRHAGYFAATAHGLSGQPALADLDNLVAACRRAVAAGLIELAVAALENAWSLLQQRGPFGLAVELAQAVAAVPEAGEASTARLEHVFGAALTAAGLVAAALPRLEAGLACARSAAEPRTEAVLLVDLGVLHVNRADIEHASQCFAQALAIARASADRSLECAALSGLASVSGAVGSLDEARGRYLQALQVARTAGDRRWEGGLLGNLGGLLWEMGQLDESTSHIQQGLAIARELGDRIWEGNALCNLGALHQAQGRLDEALAESQAALQAARALGHARLECIVQCNLGLVYLSLHDLPRAQEHYEAALTLARRLQDRRSEGQFLGYLGQLRARLGDVDGARQCLDRAEQLLRPLDDPLNLGLLHCHRAEVELLGGEPAKAELAIDAARRIREELGSGPDSELGLALTRVTTSHAGIETAG